MYGGIIGQSQQKVKITNCYNSGVVEAKNGRAAGIAAHVYAEVTVNNCYNIGKLIGSSANGLGATTISNSYNFGQITSKNPCNTMGAKTKTLAIINLHKKQIMKPQKKKE